MAVTIGRGNIPRQPQLPLEQRPVRVVLKIDFQLKRVLIQAARDVAHGRGEAPNEGLAPNAGPSKIRTRTSYLEEVAIAAVEFVRTHAGALEASCPSRPLLPIVSWHPVDLLAKAIWMLVQRLSRLTPEGERPPRIYGPRTEANWRGTSRYLAKARHILI